MNQGEPTAEFDAYAADYASLLRDPLRDRFAADASFYFRRKLEILLQALSRLGRDPARMAWLDMGCGQGDLLRMGQSHFQEAAGCDLSALMLSGCGDLETRVQPNPTTVPFEPERFDLVTAVCVYHHVIPADRSALTASAARVLRPGGLMCVIEHNRLNPATQIIVSRHPVDVDAQLLWAGTTRRILKEAGLSPIDTRYLLLLPEGLYKRFGRLERGLERVALGGQYAAFARKPGASG